MWGMYSPACTVVFQLISATFENLMATKSTSVENFQPLPAALSNKDAAKYIGYAPLTLKLSRISGELGGVPAPEFKKIGRKVIYLREVLDAWLEKQPTYQNSAQVRGGSSARQS